MASNVLYAWLGTWLQERVEKLPSLTVEQAASELLIPARAFYRVHLNGKTPAQYIRQCRVTAAKRRLRRGQPIGKVRKALGFTGDIYFSKWFTRLTGQSARDYQRRALRRTNPSARARILKAKREPGPRRPASRRPAQPTPA